MVYRGIPDATLTIVEERHSKLSRYFTIKFILRPRVRRLPATAKAVRVRETGVPSFGSLLD
jgi:hypothetical protein